MVAKHLTKSLLILLAASLLGAGLLQASVSAQGEPPPPARLPYNGLLDIPRRPLSEGATAPDAPQAAQAPDFADWTRLVFQSARNEHDWEIYNASGYGGEPWNISNHPSMDIHPRLNRGATRIVFASDRDGNYEIYVMNADGSAPTRLTYDGANDVYPAWSPDSAQIVFQSYRDSNQAEIYVMNADGSGLRRLTYHGDYDGEPAWSPDGSQIAFTRRSSDQYRVWTINADGSNPRQISDQPYSENPIWSPDGGRIAYDSDGDGDGWQELWLMDADGDNQRQMYDPGYQTDAWARSWAPGGQYIAFTRISFTQYQGEWYWTTAHINACDVSAPWNIMGLNSSGADWHPDWQKTDIWPPTSSVLPLPTQSPSPFVLEWTFEEMQSLIADLVIQMRDGPTGEWINLKTNACWGEPWDYFAGLGGHTYYFRSQAADNAGNVEPWPADYDAVTTIEALPPQTVVEALPAYNRNGVEVRWGGYDLGGSELRSYDVQVRQGDGGWTDWITEVAGTSALFSSTAGERYSFRVRGRDAAQNLEAWPTEADTSTVLYAWAISGNATDNRGASVADLTTKTTPAAFQSTPSDITGAYIAYGAEPAPNYTVAWNKAGYGALPATVFASDADATLDIVLPPADNIVQNWGFEDGRAAWQFGGNLNGEVTSSDKHTGAAAALLSSIVSAQNGSITQRTASTPASGEATLSQVVQVPPAALAPTFSFLHRFSTEFPSGSRLEVIVDDDISPITVFSTTTGADTWQHTWADLTPWAGRSVTLRFRLSEAAGGARAWAYIDEVTVGSAHPDVWLTLVSQGAAPPGATVSHVIYYGNHGATASNSYVTLQLPPELTFVSATPTPSATTPEPRWDIGDLAGGAAPAAIQVTLQVAALAIQGTTLTTTAAIASDTPEIEQANNTAHGATFVGHKIHLPLLKR